VKVTYDGYREKPFDQFSWEIIATPQKKEIQLNFFTCPTEKFTLSRSILLFFFLSTVHETVVNHLKIPEILISNIVGIWRLI
jgi:hypothetical protein